MRSQTALRSRARPERRGGGGVVEEGEGEGEAQTSTQAWKAGRRPHELQSEPQSVRPRGAGLEAA
jgi:hypothetical protein